MFSLDVNEHREQIRIDVPTWYEDARGEQSGIGKHAVFFPHEIVGSMFHFQHVDLTDRLFGNEGVPWLHAVFPVCTLYINLYTYTYIYIFTYLHKYKYTYTYIYIYISTY